MHPQAAGFRGLQFGQVTAQNAIRQVGRGRLGEEPLYGGADLKWVGHRFFGSARPAPDGLSPRQRTRAPRPGWSCSLVAASRFEAECREREADPGAGDHLVRLLADDGRDTPDVCRTDDSPDERGERRARRLISLSRAPVTLSPSFSSGLIASTAGRNSCMGPTGPSVPVSSLSWAARRARASSSSATGFSPAADSNDSRDLERFE